MLFLLFQATCMNVAFNAHNKVLLVIMMSNNFIEIKGTVFKKFEAKNLFQISCSDVRERLQLVFMLFCVLIRNFSSKIDLDTFLILFPYMVSILAIELVIDWMKHSFIIKFNHIPFETTYKKYTVQLANDIIIARLESQSSHTGQHAAVDQVCRRTCFSVLPVASLTFSITFISLKSVVAGWTKMSQILGLSFVALVLMKFCTSIFMDKYTYQFCKLDVKQRKKSGHSVCLDPFEQQIRTTVKN